MSLLDDSINRGTTSPNYSPDGTFQLIAAHPNARPWLAAHYGKCIMGSLCRDTNVGTGDRSINHGP